MISKTSGEKDVNKDIGALGSTTVNVKYWGRTVYDILLIKDLVNALVVM
jgi:hypothetical protein